jgi:hypothetical protein
MEINHPELKQKLQELDQELEVSQNISNARRSVEARCAYQFKWCLDTSGILKGIVSSGPLAYQFVPNRREILQKKGTGFFRLSRIQNVAYAPASEHCF